MTYLNIGTIEDQTKIAVLRIIWLQELLYIQNHPFSFLFLLFILYIYLFRRFPQIPIFMSINEYSEFLYKWTAALDDVCLDKWMPHVAYIGIAMLAMWSNICGCENNCVHQSKHILCTFMPCLQSTRVFIPYVWRRVLSYILMMTSKRQWACYMCGNDDLLTVRLTN